MPALDDNGLVGGVYVAVRDTAKAVHFKRVNRRPEWSLPLAALRAHWVPGSPVAYIREG